MLGLFTPIFYIQLYSINHGMDRNLAFYTVTILNGASVVRSVPFFSTGLFVLLLANCLIDWPRYS
jgi:hypothetical protein